MGSWVLDTVVLRVIGWIVGLLLLVSALALPAAATVVSVPFAEGFIGTRGSNSQQADNILTFRTLGIAKAYLLQDSTNGQFGGTQGNDYAATLKLVLASGATITVPGMITWRDGANPLHGIGFIPSATVTSHTIPYGNGLTYRIGTTSNYLVKLITSRRTYTDGQNVGGNAANTGIFVEMNTYLETTVASRPAGPVAVTPLDTFSTTPTLTGTMTMADTETLSVEVNGTVYTTANGLTVNRSAGTWSLAIPAANALQPATYSVTATISDASGYVLTDSTSHELQVLASMAVMSLVKTAAVTGDTVRYSYRVTNTGTRDIRNVTLGETADDFTGSGTLPRPAIDAAATGTADDDSLLGVGEVWTFTADYSVTQADRDAGRLSNRATVSGIDATDGTTVLDISDDGTATDADLDGQTGNDPTVTPLAQTPALALVQTASLTEGRIRYTYVVTNGGNVSLTGVTLAETAAGFTGTGTLPVPALDGTATGTAADDGILNVGESWTFTADYTVTQTDTDTGSVTGSATATARSQTNTRLSDRSDNGDATADDDRDGDAGNDPTVTLLPQSPAITLLKTASTAGNAVTYTYTVTNSGNVTLSPPVLTETAAGFSGTGTPPTPALAPATGTAANDGELDVGEVWTYSATYRLSDADFGTGHLTNSASVTATGPTGAQTADTSDDGDPADSPLDADQAGDNDPTLVAVTMSPALELVKTASLSGDQVTYRYRVTNTGNVGLTSVAITEKAEDFSGTGTLPLPRIDDATTGTADDDGVLDPGELWVYQAGYDLTSLDFAAASVSNSAAVSALDPAGGPVTDISDNDDPADGDDNPTVVHLVPEPGIEFVKRASYGDGVIHYRYEVHNKGNVPLWTVSVTEDAKGFSGDGDLPQPRLDTSLTGAADGDDMLDVDETWVFTADYTPTQADFDLGTVTNSAGASAIDPDGARVSDTSDDGDPADSPLDPDSDGGNDPTVTQLPAKAALTLTKTATADGQDIVYRYTLANSGNVTLTLTGIAESAAGFSGTGPLPVPVADGIAGVTLAVGETRSYTARYSPTPADRVAGTLTNSATALATDPSGAAVRDVSDNGNEALDGNHDGETGNDPTAIAVPTAPALAIAHKLIDLKRLFPQDYSASFLITLSNTGNLPLSDLTLVNDLAAFLPSGSLLGRPDLTLRSGPSGVLPNAAFDGDANPEILSGAALAPGESAEILVAFRFSSRSGFPSGGNVAQAMSPELAAPVAATDAMAATTEADVDGDGVADGKESTTGDRDGDGTSDASDYDPTGYFYCAEDGRILSGGSIAISKLGGGSNGAVGTANGITIVHDGSEGYYQWFASAPGTYTMWISYPPRSTPALSPQDLTATLDLSSLLPADPAVLGSTEFGDTGKLADPSPEANPRYYVTFNIEAGDPDLLANNIRLTNCATAAGTPGVTVADNDLTASEEGGDAADMGFALATAPAAPVTLTFAGDADCTVAPETMEFDANDWSTPQHLTITAIDDGVTEDAHSCTPTLRTSSADAGYDALAPALSPVTLTDGPATGNPDSLIGEIVDRLRERLAEDLAQTIDARQTQFRDMVRSAAERLDEPVPDTCKTGETIAPHGSIDGGDGTLSVRMQMSSDGDPCQTKNRPILTSGVSLLSTPQGGTALDASAGFQSETRLSDNRLRGYFLGLYLRRTATDGQGSVLATGVHAGLYGAARHANGLMTDHYIALGLGHHAYDFRFGTTDPITATGTYDYAALYGGVSLSRRLRAGPLDLTPRLALDLAHAVPAATSLTASRGGQSETGTVALAPVSLARLTLELGMANTADAPSPSLLGRAKTDWAFTPSVFCEARTQGGNGCGFGFDVEYEHISADRRRTWSLQAQTGQGFGNSDTSLTLRHSRRIGQGDSRFETSVTLGEGGTLTATQSLELRF